MGPEDPVYYNNLDLDEAVRIINVLRNQAYNTNSHKVYYFRFSESGGSWMIMREAVM